MNELIIKVAEKNEVMNYKVVRSAMDKSLNIMLDNTDIKVIYEIFNEDYDGRKISLKYFIDLCIRFLEKQRQGMFLLIALLQLARIILVY